MLRPPPVATRPDPPFPYTTPFRSSIPGRRLHRRRQGVNLKATPDVAQFGRCGKSMEFRSLNRRLRLLPAAMLLAAILAPADRSEEHTSELQSLMRISYAVFCLKKKKQQQQKKNKHTIQINDT